MKQTGITRQVDKLGRIVIPSEVRKNLGITEKSLLEIFIDNGMIILKKFEYGGCILCGNTENLADHDGTKICKSCLVKMLEQVK